MRRFPADATRRHNIFFALYPPSDAAGRIAAFADRLFEKDALRGPRVARPRLHITLEPLGGYGALPCPLIERASAAAAKVVRPSFVIAFNRLMSFENTKGPRPLVLVGEDGVIGIDLLRSRVRAALVMEGVRPQGAASFTPHLTLSREKTVLHDDFIDPFVWRARDFRLIHSPYGESRHEVLGRWLLQ